MLITLRARLKLTVPALAILVFSAVSRPALADCPIDTEDPTPVSDLASAIHDAAHFSAAQTDSMEEPATPKIVAWVKPPADTQLFFNGTPRIEDVRQGPLGDCYTLAPLADAAATDPDLIREHIQQVGVAANGDKLYGAIFYLPAHNKKSISRFQRAAPDVNGYTPIWVVVNDREAHARDGSLVSASATIPKEGHIDWVLLSEKAEAALHGDRTGYRPINDGGDSDAVMQEMTGRDSEAFDIDRAPGLAADKKLADEQFAMMEKASQQGKMVTLGTYETKDVLAALKRYPQLGPSGKPTTYFDPKKFSFADGDGNAASTGTGPIRVANSRRGAGWVSDHEYSVLKVYEQDGVKMVELRNPWGDVRPPEFSDGSKTEDGIIKVPWYTARVLFSDGDIGGRALNDRRPLQITQLPTLPRGATPVPLREHEVAQQ